MLTRISVAVPPTIRSAALLFCLLTTGCHASYSQPTPPMAMFAPPTRMGPLCPDGVTLFYGMVTDTGAEERLCEARDKTPKWTFWTKSGHANDAVGTEVFNVEKVHFKGKSGYTVGYDFTIGQDYKVGFRAAYHVRDNVMPVHAVFMLGGHAMPLDLPTLVVRP